MNAWNDFSDAPQQTYDLIPKGTVCKVHMKIKPGGYDDPAQGWTGGYATRSDKTGSVYLSPEYTVLSGPYAKRKFFKPLIGLYSPKGPEWGNQGRAFIRAALESARNVNPKSTDERAMKARQINGIADLDGLEFVVKIGIEEGNDGYDDANTAAAVITPGHKDYAAAMEGVATAAPAAATAATPKANAPAWLND